MKKFPIFLLLIGIYPILFLTANNLGQTSFSSILPSLILSFCISILISGVCLLLVRPLYKGYLFALFLNFAFFLYGHLLIILKGKEILSIDLGRNSIFLPIFTILVLVIAIIILRRPSPKTFPLLLLNIIFLCLCTFSIIRILSYQNQIEFSSSRGKSSSVQISKSNLINQKNANSPDIYYIIIDGLVSEDVMKNEFKFSEYDLPDQLRKRGFIIPACAFSNYDGTSRSLASTLNMEYLRDLGVGDSQVNTNENDPAILFTLLHKNKVLDFLKSQGYKFVSFRGFFPLNDFKEADKYYNYFENQAGYDELEERNFRSLFLQTTFLNVLKATIENHSDKFTFLPEFIFNIFAPDSRALYSRSYQWYQQHMYQFDKLEEVPSTPGKKFIYSHFYTTHQPYVFEPDGQLLWPINEDNSGYVSAVKYTSKRILEVIDSILANSEFPPIIIIQGDHGKDGTDELDNYRIMNAFYLPKSQQGVIYPTITPVNTFRIIFNQYFSKTLPILPDVINESVEGQIEFQKVQVSCD